MAAKGTTARCCGPVALPAGAYTTVRASENVVAALDVTRLVGGLFVTAIVTAVPEIFGTWSLVKSGQVTAGTTSVIGDNAVTMTVGFVPLAAVPVPIENFRLYWVNLAFVAVVAATFGALVHFDTVGEHGFERWQVLVLDGVYGVYVPAMATWVLGVVWIPARLLWGGRRSCLCPPAPRRNRP